MRAPAEIDGMGSLLAGGSCRFRVWAPNAKRVQVVGEFNGGAALDLAAEGSSGNWSADGIAANAGARYQYIITNRGGENNDNSQEWFRTDARALAVEGSGQESRGYIVENFPEHRQKFTTPAFENFLVYQLHVGSFAGHNDGISVKKSTATYVDVTSKLDYIRGLGFNAIETLPLQDSNCDLNGTAGEGYGPCDLYASEDRYATAPEKAVAELIELIDAAHLKGLAVIVDVVHNHASSFDNRYWRYDGNFAGEDGGGGIYHVHGHNLSWGAGFAVWQREVRDFLLDNARMYLRDYRVDGLRFDAVQAIDPEAVQYIVHALRREFKDKYLIAEYNPGDRDTSVAGGIDPYDPVGGLGFCATWDLGSPGDAFELLEGRRVTELLQKRIGTFSDPNPWHVVSYLTGSHDQIFNGQGCYITQRFGGRGNGFARAKARLAWALNATLAATPMMFMGTEGHSDGYWDPSVGSGDHRVDWNKIGDELGGPMQTMVRDINNLRWAHGALRAPAGMITHVDDANGIVAFKRYTLDGDVLLVLVNVGDGQWVSHDYEVWMAGETGLWQEIFNSQAPVYGGIGTTGNFGFEMNVVDDRIAVSLPSWSLLVLQKL